jgi:hypothetical protein
MNSRITVSESPRVGDESVKRSDEQSDRNLSLPVTTARKEHLGLSLSPERFLHPLHDRPKSENLAARWS